jgi:hypothetical protein
LVYFVHNVYFYGQKSNVGRIPEAKAMSENEATGSHPRSWFRFILPVFLVMAVAASIWYASPTPVKALEIDYSALPSGTLGNSYTFSVTVRIQDTEHLPLQSINVFIYKADNPVTYRATLADMPLGTSGTSSHNPSEGTGSGVATVSAIADANWGYTASATGYANWKGTGYSFSPATSGGYGYQSGYGSTSIVYTIVWTPPLSWPGGSYKVDTTLTTAPRSPGNGTTFTETSSMFTLVVPPAEVLSGGGGAVSNATGTTYVYNIVTSDGRFTQGIVASSGDDKVSITIQAGVIGKSSGGGLLNRIEITPVDSQPTPPLQSSFIGLAYNFSPEGATFDPPITVTFSYDLSDIPAGFSEKTMTIGYYDAVKNIWVLLQGVTINTTTHTISALISHFSMYAVLATPQPAAPSTTPAAATTVSAISTIPAAAATPTTTSRPTTAPAPAGPTTPAVKSTTPAPAPTSTVTPMATTPAEPAETAPNTNWLIIGVSISVIAIAVVAISIFIIRRRGS